MRPLFFGESSRQLFGVYSAPQVPQVHDHAVLICPPAPQEYMLTHWAQRRLAGSLSKAGLHVLRFDYFGTGDSAGSIREATLEDWQRDIGLAEQELRALSGAGRVSIVGYRLGAALAWRATQHAEFRARDLVLWDPVVNGRSYIRELQIAESTFASRLLYFPPQQQPPRELLGFPFPTAQRVSTEALDLLHEPLPNATRVHLHVGRETPAVSALSARLSAELKRFSYECIPEEGAKGSGNLLSSQILQVITAALAPEPA